MKLRRRDLGHLGSTAEKLERMEAKEAKQKSQAGRMKAMAIGAVEAVGTNFTMGLVHGRQGGVPALAGIPLDGALGAAGLALGVTGAAGKFSDDAFFVGLGALGYWAGWQGVAVGQKMRKKAGKLTGATMTEDEAKKNNVQVRTITAGAPASNVRQGSFVGAVAR